MWSTTTKLSAFKIWKESLLLSQLTKCISYLFQFVKAKEFVKAIQLWRQRKVPDDLKGYVWHTFLDVDGNRFVDAPMLFLNVDWFQPFTHLTDSLGAIYLSVQNIQPADRYKLANVILLGIIPKSLRHTMNQYLSHLVEELKEFWYGVEIPFLNSVPLVVVRLALTGMSCDYQQLGKHVASLAILPF
jgi:hypothetical protein